MALSDYERLNHLNALRGGATYSAPSALYIALSTTAYNADGTGGTELSGNGYARATGTFGTPTTGGGGKQMANSSAVTFPQCTGGSTAPGYWGAYDASSGGNLRFSGTITTPITISNGITPNFATGQLVHTEA